MDECKNCGGSGKSPGSQYLDCLEPGCRASADRAIVDAFVGGLPAHMEISDVVWAVYNFQRQSSQRIAALEEEVAGLRGHLRYAISEADGWFDECRGGRLDDAGMNAARAASEGQPPTVQAWQWVNVDDRLPEENELVLVFNPESSEELQDIRLDLVAWYPDANVVDWVFHNEDRVDFQCSEKPSGSVEPPEKAPYTHWMPLPPAPEVAQASAAIAASKVTA